MKGKRKVESENERRIEVKDDELKWVEKRVMKILRERFEKMKNIGRKIGREDEEEVKELGSGNWIKIGKKREDLKMKKKKKIVIGSM